MEGFGNMAHSECIFLQWLSLNRSTEPIQSLSHNVRLCVCLCVYNLRRLLRVGLAAGGLGGGSGGWRGFSGLGAWLGERGQGRGVTAILMILRMMICFLA